MKERNGHDDGTTRRKTRLALRTQTVLSSTAAAAATVMTSFVWPASAASSSSSSSASASSSSSSSSSSSRRNKFVWLSDIHYDPYYGQSGAASGASSECASSESAAHLGMKGCDSPLALMESAIFASADASSNPAFVLLTGDMARHYVEGTHDPWTTLREVYNGTVSSLVSAFPNSSIVVALGNNDAVADYYLDASEENATELALAADAFLELFESEEEERTFRAGGYYARHVAVVDANVDGGDDGSAASTTTTTTTTTTATTTILSLNTVIYSRFHEPSNQSSLRDPLGQFAWMAVELSEAREDGRSVLIAGHIPPTIGSYRKEQFWYDNYLRRYLALLEEYSDVVAAQLFGHLHSDEFRVISFRRQQGGGNGDGDGDGEGEGTFSSSEAPSDSEAETTEAALAPPLLITSSVTPVYDSNPSFRVVEYDSMTGTIMNYESHYLDFDDDDDSTWDSTATTTTTTRTWQKLYSFQEAYGVEDVSVHSLQRILSSMMRPLSNDDNGNNDDDDDALQTFLMYQKAGATPSDQCFDENGDDGDGGSCRARWVCVLQSSNRYEYDLCLSSLSTSSSRLHVWGVDRWRRSAGDKSTILGVFAATTAAALAMLILVVARIRQRREHRGTQYEDVDSVEVNTNMPPML